MSHRFTVSLHRVGPGSLASEDRGDHLDWFFAVNHDANSPLVTWSTSTCWHPHSGHPALQLPAHRARYLDYDGEIAGDRGQVQRLVGGFYQLLDHDAVQFIFAVESVAVVKMSAASPADQVALSLARQLCEQLNNRLDDPIQL